MHKVTAIAAIDADGGIGKFDASGKLVMPWHLPEDLAHFRRATMDGSCIMGSATYEAMGRKALDGRRNIVLSSKKGTKQMWWQRVITAHSLQGALDVASGPVFIIGGAQVYRHAFAAGIIDRVMLTVIDKKFGCDRHFVNTQFLHGPAWECTESDTRYSDKLACSYSFLTFEHRNPLLS